MLATIKRLASLAAKAHAALATRFAQNKPANDYEEIIFNAIRLGIVRYGRI